MRFNLNFSGMRSSELKQMKNTPPIKTGAQFKIPTNPNGFLIFSFVNRIVMKSMLDPKYAKKAKINIIPA